jgi:hypothetical protein
MARFSFHPELFEHRANVIERLAMRGFLWLSHYSAVDPMHEEFGIEVCGIHARRDAMAILSILKRMFPRWHPG